MIYPSFRVKKDKINGNYNQNKRTWYPIKWSMVLINLKKNLMISQIMNKISRKSIVKGEKEMQDDVKNNLLKEIIPRRGDIKNFKVIDFSIWI